MKRILVLVALGLTSVPPSALANPAPAQEQVREQQKAGHVRPLRQIEQHVLPKMRGMQYLGPEYDPAAMAYRLKFIDDGKVHFVDVDARTGKIIARSP